jgi:hypothetical protein
LRDLTVNPTAAFGRRDIDNYYGKRTPEMVLASCLGKAKLLFQTSFRKISTDFIRIIWL